MMGVATVAETSGLEPLFAAGTGVAELVLRGDPQLCIGHAQRAVHLAIDPRPTLPTARDRRIRIRGALADHQRIGRAVADGSNGRRSAPDWLTPGRIGREVTPIDKDPLVILVPRVPLIGVRSV